MLLRATTTLSSRRIFTNKIPVARTKYSGSKANDDAKRLFDKKLLKNPTTVMLLLRTKRQRNPAKELTMSATSSVKPEDEVAANPRRIPVATVELVKNQLRVIMLLSTTARIGTVRSEERRVGKEGRSRWWP